METTDREWSERLFRPHDDLGGVLATVSFSLVGHETGTVFRCNCTINLHEHNSLFHSIFSSILAAVRGSMQYQRGRLSPTNVKEAWFVWCRQEF